MKTADFSFHLPEDLIAQNPADPRDSCRLMLLDRNNHSVGHFKFFDLPKLLKPGDVLVMNNSKVLPARILFDFGGKNVELFLLRRDVNADWFAIGKPGKLLIPGKVFTIAPGFSFEVIECFSDGRKRVRFMVQQDMLDTLIEKYGKTPLPPYIHHSSSKPDDYQTVYSKHVGSVAAPTAGLHFTSNLLDELSNAGVKTVFVTLHVGLGTFLPVKTDDVEKHTMHSELFELSADAARELQIARTEGRRIIAVGTTAVRVLESSFDDVHGFVPQIGETSIYIYPGYVWRSVDGLITNFHLPQSSLLLLTCSFGGTDFVLQAYQKAIDLRYRFYSFGDAMLIL